MIRDLKLKHDFPRTIERFEAWWLGQIIDRPPVSLHVTPTRQARLPRANHASERDRWMDVEYVVDAAIARLEARDWVGDSFPSLWPNLGPEISATIFGCELEFGETTSWSKPVVHGPDDWRRILAMAPDFDNIYWRTMEQIMDRAIAVNDGRYIVGMTDLHGAYDILAALREPMHICTDLLDHPDLVVAAGRHVATAYAEATRRQLAKVAAAGCGSTTWCAFYHEGPAYIPSCDLWCMLSPQIAREDIFPTIVTEMEPLERSIFHLDGPQALKHLDLMLELPGLNALQWVYGAGHGPAAKWISTYQRAQAAGKSLQIFATDAQDALTVLKALKPEGVWLTMGESFDSVDTANAFLREVERTAARRHG
ncbi:MAG: hypothetical protein K8T26_13810 [Lentisphaerae bacterium]|nr:hypothetical protein [Lentisphaerota bacterium]